MSTERIDLSEQVAAICQRLDINPNTVKSLTIRPRQAEAEVFKINDQGAKYIDERGRTAIETRTFEVRT